MRRPATTASRASHSPAIPRKDRLFCPFPRIRLCASTTRLVRNTRLIAVLFADKPYSLAWVDTLADAGFASTMLYTARKTGKTLRDWRSAGELDEFVG